MEENEERERGSRWCVGGRRKGVSEPRHHWALFPSLLFWHPKRSPDEGTDRTEQLPLTEPKLCQTWRAVDGGSHLTLTATRSGGSRHSRLADKTQGKGREESCPRSLLPSEAYSWVIVIFICFTLTELIFSSSLSVYWKQFLCGPGATWQSGGGWCLESSRPPAPDSPWWGRVNVYTSCYVPLTFNSELIIGQHIREQYCVETVCQPGN